MAGVGPGSTIGGRFTLRTIVHRAPRGQRWSALDTRTGMPVCVLLVPSGSPVADAVTDAARRAAVLEDEHLVRIVDIGTDAGYAYVAEESVDGTTLTELLHDGPLAPEEARRVVGESALTLERARQRGLHHEELTPDHVRLAHDGHVTLRGLGLDAALADRPTSDGRVASRTDAAGLTALLYAALTGTWPLRGTPLTQSPRVGGRVVAPSELVGGITADLDDAATAGLGNGPDVPAIPADVAELIAPWSEAPVGRIVDAGPAAATEAYPTVDRVDPSQLPDELRGDIEHPPSKAAVAAGAVAGAVGDAARTAARNAAERAAERRREDVERREAERASERSFHEIAATATAKPEPVAPVLARDIPTATPSRSQAKFVLGCLSAFVAVSLLLAAIGIFNMVKTIDDKVAMGAGPTPTRVVTAPAVTVTAGAPGAPATSAPGAASAAPVPIVGVQAFDPPPGDGTENDAMLPLLHDDNPDTSWQSSRYTTQNFGGIKQGVGLVVDLGRAAPVRAIEVALKAPGVDYTVYGADSQPTSITGLPKLGSATDARDTSTVTVSGAPAAHQYYVIWFTKPAPVPNGFRIMVSEIKMSS